MINVGFTGTRKGMSKAQLAQLEFLLRQFSFGPGTPELHHGMAIGADQQAQRIAVQLRSFTIVGYPVSEEVGPLVRNRKIVEACDVLIAAPETDAEVLRSGTWATVRYARAAGKPVVMLSRGGRR